MTLTKKKHRLNLLSVPPFSGTVFVYALSFAVAPLVVEMPWQVVIISTGLAAVLIALTIFDETNGILPDVLTVPLAFAGLVVTWWLQSDSIVWRLFSALAAGAFVVLLNAIYRRVRQIDGIGYGDAKLLAASGAWLGLYAIPSVLLWACASGLSLMLVKAIRCGDISRTSELAFGPHLAFGMWLVWLFGAI